VPARVGGAVDESADPDCPDVDDDADAEADLDGEVDAVADGSDGEAEVAEPDPDVGAAPVVSPNDVQPTAPSRTNSPAATAGRRTECARMLWTPVVERPRSHTGRTIPARRDVSGARGR
jgi:hypothetical protein